MKHTKTEQVLQIICDGLSTADSIFDALLGGYGRAYARARKNVFAPDWPDWGKGKRRRGPSDFEIERFYSFLNYLKREGLIEKRKDRKHWELTHKGGEKLKGLQDRSRFFVRSIDYVSEEDNKLRVVIFDIPEQERHRRTWLRASLVALGFSMCQQSVWVGKRKIPRKFLEDLRDRELLAYVHIFEISKQGSLSGFLS
ncbi:MAG: CRISPR-associated endonuclease Cas2 [Candidatus Wolfebacteria bacterium]|nr:CRISPR-associated endonuclease Cas2 [Candidatus Wolfebacteria bacterium]MDP2704676.1 CRISPR-associated endonuclease Cas2 [bacterium]